MQLIYATELVLFFRIISKHTHAFVQSQQELKNSIGL
jgi:hypothetical protein